MLDTPQFETFFLPLTDAVTLGFYFIVSIYAVFTAIFYYHWQSYGTDTKITGLTLVLYFVTTVPLLTIMGIMTFII